ncbi:hypothetical protein KR032_007966, partial [Drosophila birchii]
KKPRSAETATMEVPASKRKGGPKLAGPPPSSTKPPKTTAKASEVTKRHLIVSLIDRSDENGKMSEA